MRQARLYDNPQQFAEMMMRQLGQGLDAIARQREGEPLLLEIGPDNQSGKRVISLHNTYRTYMASGDLNVAIKYLNDVIRTSNYLNTGQVRGTLDAEYIFPAIRDERYVEEGGSESPFLSDECLPGLRVIYLEIKDGITKIINKALLEQNPQFDEEIVRRQAFANLKAAGWRRPQMSLKVPSRESCTVNVFMENPHPIECQFLLPEWKRHLPASFLIAFTNRMNMMIMHTTERMDSLKQAIRLADRTRFREVVQRSFYLMPSPVSKNIYWVHGGEAQLLEG